VRAGYHLCRCYIFAFRVPSSRLRQAFVTPSARLRRQSRKSLQVRYLRSDSPLYLSSLEDLYRGCHSTSHGTSEPRLGGCNVVRVAGASEPGSHGAGDIEDWACIPDSYSRAIAEPRFSICRRDLQFFRGGTCEVQPLWNSSTGVAVRHFLDVIGECCWTLTAVTGLRRVRPDGLMIKHLTRWHRSSRVRFSGLNCPASLRAGSDRGSSCAVVGDVAIGCNVLPNRENPSTCQVGGVL